MTNVTIDIGDKHMLIKVEGHAFGSKEVCAAASSLSYALAGFLKNYAPEDGETKTMSIQDGYTCFDLRSETNISDEVRGAFMTCAIGYMQIAMLKPEFLKAIDLSKDA